MTVQNFVLVCLLCFEEFCTLNVLTGRRICTSKYFTFFLSYFFFFAESVCIVFVYLRIYVFSSCFSRYGPEYSQLCLFGHIPFIISPDTCHVSVYFQRLYTLSSFFEFYEAPSPYQIAICFYFCLNFCSCIVSNKSNKSPALIF